MAKYAPKTKVELQELIKNESINLGDIDVSGITEVFITKKNFIMVVS